MGQRAESLGRVATAAAPTLLGFIGVLMLCLPVRLAEGFIPTPLLPLVVIYFWSIYGPNYLPAPSSFVIGLLQDLLTGGPIGLWALIYLLMQYVVLSQRTYFNGREQQVVWSGFIVVSSGVFLVLWLVMSLLLGQGLPVVPLVFQWLSTIATYPVLAIFFNAFHRRVIVEM